RSSATVLTSVALWRVAEVASPTRTTSPAVSTVRLAAGSTPPAISLGGAPRSVPAGARSAPISPSFPKSGPQRPERRRCARGGLLHARDLRANVLGCFCRLPGQRFHFAGDDCKAATGIAGARCFDCGVQREQIGLFGDVRDQADHVANAPGCLVELLHHG